MNEKQFELLMEKLEMIRCGIIDLEDHLEQISKNTKSSILGFDIKGSPNLGRTTMKDFDKCGGFR